MEKVLTTCSKRLPKAQRTNAWHRGTLRKVALASVMWCGFACSLSGCVTSLDPNLIAATEAGRYGGARVAIQDNLTNNPSDRAYILDRLRLSILTLADGQPDIAEIPANQLFSLLTTQGVNADRTVSSVVINERVKIWKGEPFEQALGYHYIAMQKAMRGEWDNARAAAGASLFLLKDFSQNQNRDKRLMTTEQLARRAAEMDRRNSGSGTQYLNSGYVASETDFVLGYLMNAIANLSLARLDEARDNFNQVRELNPTLVTLCDQLESGQYNTVFVVDYGRGPEKIAYGPDNALVTFAPRMRSDSRRLEVTFGERTTVYPAVCDVNVMSKNHMWNNLEDVRSAKSTIGSLVMIGGTAVAVSSDDEEAQLAGVLVAAVGALIRASAKADTRHCEFFPQRVFLFPANITKPGATIMLSPEQDERSRIVLTDLSPPDQGVGTPRFALRYVRLNANGPLNWATSGRIYYANDHRIEEVPGDTLPYIMGGNCVRSPDEFAMQRYRQGGNLTDLTASELANLYREEGIALAAEDQRGKAQKHILEGGTSLVAPLSGSTGYQRLFGQPHESYKPRSSALRNYITQHRGFTTRN